MFADKSLQVPRRFHTIVKRNFWEKVMNDVTMSDIVKKESALPSQKWSIDGGSGTSLKIPLFLPEMGNILIGVMQICDHGEPVINFKPGNAIVFYHCRNPPDRARTTESPYHGDNASTRNENRVTLRPCK